MRVITETTLYYFGKNEKTKGGKSDKFYTVQVVEKDAFLVIRTRWGRYGTEGQTKEHMMFSHYDAVRFANRMLKKKRRKGYTDAVSPLLRLADAAE